MEVSVMATSRREKALMRSSRPDDELGMDRLAGAIVLFRPDGKAFEHVALALTQVDMLYVVDNSPQGESDLCERLKGMGNSRIAIIHEGVNIGLGAAYNLACSRAVLDDFDWLVLLDQDTRLHPQYRRIMLFERDCWRSNGGSLGAMAPGFQNMDVREAEVVGAPGLNAVAAVISSGSLISLAAWAAVGHFREDFFIDYVDIEFCRRLSYHGYSVLMLGEVLMSHGIGHLHVNRVLRYERLTSNYPAWRHYFMVRNFVVTAKLSLEAFDLLWLAKEANRRIKFALLSFIMEPGRLKMLRCSLRGAFHGVRGDLRYRPLSD